MDNLHLTALRTQSLPFRIQEFIDYRVVDIANKTLVRAIIDEAHDKHIPQRYIDSIKVDYGNKELWIWVGFKGRKGQPLDIFFEEGTKDHEIKPRTKKALSFIERGAIGVASGIRFFSKGHWVSGIEARHVFRDGLRKGYPEFKKTLQDELEEYLRENSLFG